MTKEYVVQVTDSLAQPDAFARFEDYWAPEQELVRCKDCKWRENTGASTQWLPCMEVKRNGNWFCADGERK